MLVNARHLIGYTLESPHGEIGKVKGFHCDDQHWAIHHLIADMGHWFKDRQILVPPSAITGVNKQMKTFEINLTKQQIDDIPVLADSTSKARQVEHAGDPHLRSSQNLIRSHVQGTDGELGYIDDFLIDIETWAIPYFIIDPWMRWLGKKVIFSALWIERVNWLEEKVYVNLPRATMKQTSQYTVLEPLTTEHEANFHQRREDWIKPMSRILRNRERGDFLTFKKRDHYAG
jgi:hypothetical protein